jgi:exodeoxyribonuclease-5
MSDGIVFNEQQNEAIELAVAWFRRWRSGDKSQQVFFLAGMAGTGKTSVARAIADKCAEFHQVEFIAPTGKAASRLRQKGCHHARTLHQFVFRLRGEDEDGNPIYAAKQALDRKPLLVVLDECSMVGEYDASKLLQHRIPVLALGDLGQLPPVRASAAFSQENVDYELTQIMRQAESSNIIRAAAFIRQGKTRLPTREYDDVRVREGRPPLNELLDHSGEDGVVLCSFNNTRQRINSDVRRALGFTDDLPQAGEKVVCLANQHDHGVMNGEQGIVIEYFQEVCASTDDFEDEEDDGTRIRIRSLSDGAERTARFDKRAFSEDEEVRKEFSKKAGAFDIGYALTIHKSQGSEWDKVLVVEETMRGGDHKKLLYTAVTRASQRLTIYR